MEKPPKPAEKKIRRVERKAASAVRAKKTSHAAATFPVVGIGASAGGLSAVSQLLRYLPDKIGMAVVVIQHLDPKHGSLTTDILSRTSAKPVAEAVDGTRVESDHIYVIPPNRNLRIARGILKLSPRPESKGAYLPIDIFFESLAADKTNQAIGVVLSGIASDGTMGLKAIKNEGGLTFAQDPKTAQYDGMPRSAILSGAADIVESPKGIAEEIGRISRVFPLQNFSASLLEKRGIGTQGSLQRIFAIVRTAFGIDFTYYKQSTIQRRIARRQFALKIPDLQSYTRYLADHPEEVKTLVEEMLIQVTSFFRDPETFDCLKTQILPKYMTDWDQRIPLRIWVPGCATGEEAYSIAMIVFEFLEKAKLSAKLQIFASDVSELAIQKARMGVYPESGVKDVSKGRLRRYFEKTETGYRIAKQVRDTCLFSTQDVTADPPFARVDIISSRNVLIYFAPELQKRVVPIFHYALNPGGILWLGKSESIGQFSNLFAVENRTGKFYSKKQTATPVRIEFPVPRYPVESLTAATPKIAEVGAAVNDVNDVQREADRIAIREYAPPGVVINDSCEILQVRGRPAPYLELTSGQPSLNLFRLARPEIIGDLRYLIDLARRRNGPSEKAGLRMENEAGQKIVNVKVVPLRLPAQYKDRCFSIFFEETADLTESGTPEAKSKKAGPKQPTAGDRRMAQQQISENQNYQRALVEEYETTQEEITSANEELQSTNEELQSTNEELETAKEELQSANEEMTTVNDELQHRNTEMTQLTNDLTNLLVGVDMPIVMVSLDGRIRRFTPKAGQVLKLIGADIGRPISDIKTGIEGPDLDELVASVMETMTLKEIETHDKQDSWYRIQVRPYRTIENKIDGAVIGLTDITVLKHAAEQLKNIGDDARNIIETTPTPILVITSDLRVHMANQSFYQTFRCERSETDGKVLSELDSGQWRIPSLLEMLGALFDQGTEFRDFEIEFDAPRVGKRHLILNSKRTYLAGFGKQAALLAIEDMTEKRTIALRLEAAEERYRSLVEGVNDSIVLINEKGNIEFTNRRAETMFGYSPGELNAQPYEVLILDPMREVHQKAGFMRRREAREFGRSVDLFGKRKDGVVFPADISISPVTMNSHSMVTVIIRDISERKRLEVERQSILANEKQARIEAELANRTKDEFLAILSHELRTPLTTILSWMHLLRSGRGDLKKGMAVIERSANDQSQLIEDLLDVSRIQAGKLELDRSIINPSDHISAAVDSVRALAQERSQTIETEFAPSAGKISADPVRLEQVLRNLLTNAIKFTPPRGKISVQLKSAGTPPHKGIQIQVKDTGRGIKAEFLPRLFSRFTQADSSATRGYGGLGLGLSIVRHLVEMHGGKVMAESPGEGKGATFTVDLPYVQTDRVPRQKSEESKYRLTENDGAGAPANLAGLKVLIVEDVKDTREAFQQFLQSLGAKVQTAASADKGFAAVTKFKPDVLLGDIAMPGKDGYNLIRRIRALKPREGGRTPTVAVTAYAANEDVRRAREAKYDVHLAKPVDLVNLSHVIAKLANKAK